MRRRDQLAQLIRWSVAGSLFAVPALSALALGSSHVWRSALWTDTDQAGNLRLPESGKGLWTTPADSDTCREFPATDAPDFSTFPNRAACERWVATRRCRPGSSCFDGCNWCSCSKSGDGSTCTAMACSHGFGLHVEFTPRSSHVLLSHERALRSRLDKLQKPLVGPLRRMIVSGQADADELPTPSARERLALQRAKAVKHLLIDMGLAPERVDARAAISGNVTAELALAGRRHAHGRYVSLALDPATPMRDDFRDTPMYYVRCGSRP